MREEEGGEEKPGRWRVKMKNCWVKLRVEWWREQMWVSTNSKKKLRAVMNIKFHRGALDRWGGPHRSPRQSPPRHHAFIPPVRKNLHSAGATSIFRRTEFIFDHRGDQTAARQSGKWQEEALRLSLLSGPMMHFTSTFIGMELTTTIKPEYLCLSEGRSGLNEQKSTSRHPKQNQELKDVVALACRQNPRAPWENSRQICPD